MTRCKDCKHFNEGQLPFLGFCTVNLPAWLQRALDPAWDMSRTVRTDESCDLGVERK